ncbi:histone-lysine N-methyltransferase SETMAR [Nephila pilipes]|uniref:Histone-lysine N-methyltransferase SETMAR n=1 Tax=Nephila pilipes TaxID=299642 RepID=A0A8X6UGH0_NEPPI|nr:histone-lysine N-methyltransferase SETMAR [Nephila pilipes]
MNQSALGASVNSTSSRYTIHLFQRLEIKLLITIAISMGLSEAASSRQICQAFGDSDVNEHTTRHWLKKFRSEDLSLCDEPRCGRPQILDDEVMPAAIEEEDSSLTYGEPAKLFNVSDKRVRIHLHW